MLETSAQEMNCSSTCSGTTSEPEQLSSSPGEDGGNVPAIVAGAVVGAAAIGGVAAGVAIYKLKKSGKKLNIGKRLSKVFGNVTDNPLYKQAAIEGHNPMFESGAQIK